MFEPNETPETAAFTPPAPPTRPRKPGFGLLSAAGWLALYLSSYALVVAVALFLLVVKKRDYSPDDVMDALETGFLPFLLVPFIAALGLPILRFGKQTRRLLAIRGIHARHFWVCLGVVLPLGLCGGHTARLVNYAIRHLRSPEGTRLPDQLIDRQNTDGEPSAEPEEDESAANDDPDLQLPWGNVPSGILFLGIVLLAPVGEEVFFRGFLGRGLVARYGTAVGIGLTSLVFGALHFENWGKIVGTMVLGIGFHAAYLMTRTLFAPILIHIINNYLAFTNLLAARGTVAAIPGATLPPSFSVAALGMAGVTLAVFGATLYQTRTRWVLPDGQEWSPGYAGAEMPPADLGATPVSQRAHPVLVLLTIVTFLAMLVALGHMGSRLRRS
jgi:membrane protease YdiL (CAAX protease family)